jgi:hypothetical protein
MNKKVDGLTGKVEVGFSETKAILTEQQQATLGMQRAMEAMMLASTNFQNSVTGLLKVGMASRPGLPTPHVLPAICAPSSRSTVTEMHDEPPFARGGGGPSERSVESGLTGADIDPIMQACVTSGFLDTGMLFKAICNICGKTGLSDYHRKLISSIGKVTTCDNLATLLFLLLTGSKQFRSSDFCDFRTSCDTMLGSSNRARTQATFSNVCDIMLKSMSDWKIAKKEGISVSNGDLKNKSKRESVFDILVENFLPKKLP